MVDVERQTILRNGNADHNDNNGKSNSDNNSSTNGIRVMEITVETRVGEG